MNLSTKSDKLSSIVVKSPNTASPKKNTPNMMVREIPLAMREYSTAVTAAHCRLYKFNNDNQGNFIIYPLVKRPAFRIERRAFKLILSPIKVQAPQRQR